MVLLNILKLINIQIYPDMAKKFKSFETRDKPKKRGPRQHKKSLNKNEKRQKSQRRYKGQG